MIESIGSIGTNIYQNYRELQITTDKTVQASSFDNLLSNNIVKTTNEPILELDGITPTTLSEPKSQEITTSSNNSSNEMDLNKDGLVTSDEIIRYIQMQMVDRMAEEICSDEGTSQMEQQTQNTNNLDALKNKVAKAAYKVGEAIIDTTNSATSYSLLL